MATIYLGLGSNVGDTQKNIEQAVILLGEKISNIRVSSLDTSKAELYEEQEDFLNGVLVGVTDLAPEELLKFVKDVEKKVGRVERFRWGPREIDIDILLYGDLVYQSDTLTIPHPGVKERAFVRKPLLELNPHLAI